jgi:ATP-dependent DNA helicase Rep
LLVLAGAGSGKTRVITAKIAHLIEHGTDPARIVAITFTNKAAREMRERAQALLKAQGKSELAARVTIATFHAMGLKILRSEAKACGLTPRFSIFDPADLEAIVAELVATADRGRARAAQWRISAWKNALIAPAVALASARNDDELAAARAYANYGEALAAYQAVDFDDLIVRPLALLESDGNAASRWQARCAHVLVDEYQDTNPAQYRLLRALVGASTPFTCVGDDDQAIYGWRGATVANLERLPRDYPSLKVIKLEQNYRSSIRILRSANALIGHNTKLFDKALWSDLGLGEPIQVAPAADDQAEAENVARTIAALKFEHGTRFDDFAVLYRGNHQARAFEQALRAQNMPYSVSGGQSWFDRTEIRDIVAYLRLIANDEDDPAFVRAVTTPRRGVGAQTLEHLGRAGGLFAAACDDGLTSALPARQREALTEFCRMINGLRYRAEREPAGRLIDELIKTIGYEDHLCSTCDKREAQTRWESVVDFVRWLSTKGESDGRNLLELTQSIALLTLLDGEEGREPDAVRLSTLHAAKGLEFAHVFLVGLEEGVLPHREAIVAGNIDEERRLMYVGLTRAQQSLRLSWCRRRKRAGEWHGAEPSRFIGELAQEDLRHAEAALGPADAAREKEAGNARLRQLRAMLTR